jgi:putative FmdB family regulatory protein
MPTYEYACTECGDRLEVVQRFSDAPLTTCPACQGKLRKLFSPVGVVFKGSGFYKTDSRNGKPKTASGATSKDGDSTATSGTSDKPSGSDSSTSANGTSKPSESKPSESKPSTSTSSESSSSGGASTGGGSKVA